jgi:hypothetical protein
LIAHFHRRRTSFAPVERKKRSIARFDGGRTLSEFDDTAQARDSDAITATARLPGLAIEIVHRRASGGDAEQISINLQALPSFEAFGRFAEGMNPFVFWAQAMQMAWLPWLAAAEALSSSRSSLPQITRDGARSADNSAGSK